jgi:hypothetical protein
MLTIKMIAGQVFKRLSWLPNKDSDKHGWLLDNHFSILYGCLASILTATMIAGQVFKRLS